MGGRMVWSLDITFDNLPLASSIQVIVFLFFRKKIEGKIASIIKVGNVRRGWGWVGGNKFLIVLTYIWINFLARRTKFC
jgi:hypothetical protein